jgi:hypothetical protein
MAASRRTYRLLKTSNGVIVSKGWLDRERIPHLNHFDLGDRLSSAQWRALWTVRNACTWPSWPSRPSGMQPAAASVHSVPFASFVATVFPDYFLADY